MNITIDKEFQKLIPPLTDEELTGLEASLLTHGCLDALVVWDQGWNAKQTQRLYVLVDGHNRYALCNKHDIRFTVKPLEFKDRIEARVWIRNNQMARRNLNDSQRLELEFGNKEDLLEKGKEKKVKEGKKARNKQLGVLSNVDNTPEPSHDTRKEIADKVGVATGTVAKAEIVRRKSPDKWQECQSGKKSINKAYTEVKREEKRAELTKPTVVQAKKLAGVYDVIVVDPPWPMEKIEREVRPNQVKPLDYPTMTEDEIALLSLPMADDCHVWLWTTHRFLPMAFQVLEIWRVKYVCAFVWHKPGGFQPVGLPQFNCEFALYGRRGSPVFVDTKGFPTCFDGSRGKHSEKPDAFYEMVRRVTGGRRLDMFNRRSIEGFDGWGHESK